MKRMLIISNGQFGYGMGYHHIVDYLRGFYEIDFFCFKTDLPAVENDKVNFLYYPYKLGENRYIRILKFTLKAIKLTYIKKYDVVIVNQGYLDILIALFSKSKLKINYILTGNLNDNKIIRYLKNFIIKVFTLPFDKVFVLSDGMLKMMKLPQNKTNVMPLGSNPISSKIKNYDKMHFIYLGTFYKRKIEITINAFIKFYTEFNENISLKYYLVGIDDTEIWKMIENLIKEHNLQNVIYMSGKKNHFELKEIFDDCTIGVGFVPQTEYYEYQPSTKIIEYALSGLIAIATNTYENRRMINSDNGVICEDNENNFYEAIIKVYNRLNDYNCEKIQKSLYHFSWGEIVKGQLLPILNV